ncbi:hypothetical protein [Leifsonia poae]|uniref:Uncharacterized protein n=1 Tax=Leifsonia poae TaxID=110933 RepID=A0A9W6LYQ3_9MICO|nr:hypothetical protein [Leifsonia poae]GLJ74849.1 hypothetical protein GCM10017584_04220 [Leifsonia poae]
MVSFSDVHSTATNEFIIAPAHHKAIRVTLRAGFYRTFTVPMHVKTRITIVDGCSTDWTPTEDEPEMHVTFKNPRFEGDTPRCTISDGTINAPPE